MAGETEEKPSGLTVDTLHLMMNKVLAEMDRRYEERFKAQQAAVAEKDATTQARLANINEFRAQLGDVLAQSLPRAEAEQHFNSIDAKIDASITQQREAIALINSRLDLSAGGRRGIEDARVWVAALLGMAGVAVSLVISLTR